MGILKCLSWFEMSTHIKDCVSFESFPFVDVGVQECCFLIGNFSRKFDRRVMIVCLFNEMFYSVSVCSPEREDVVYVTFPNERFKNALAKDFCLCLLLVIVQRLLPFRHVACRNVARAIDCSQKKRTRNASLRAMNSGLWRCWARDFFFPKIRLLFLNFHKTKKLYNQIK